MNAVDQSLDDAFFKTCSHAKLINNPCIDISSNIDWRCSFFLWGGGVLHVEVIVNFDQGSKCQHNFEYLLIGHDNSLILEVSGNACNNIQIITVLNRDSITDNVSAYLTNLNRVINYGGLTRYSRVTWFSDLRYDRSEYTYCERSSKSASIKY